MPVLLAPEQAPSLTNLLASINTAGLNILIAGNPKSDPLVQGIGSLQLAGPNEISFLSNPRLKAELDRCKAAVVIVPPEVFETLKDRTLPYVLVECDQPYLLYALLAQWFDRHRINQLPGGIHPSAIIHDSVRLEANVHIGPHCVIEAHAVIGAGSRLGPGCVVGEKSVLGRDCLLHSHVTLYHGIEIGSRAILHSGSVIGADGFGFAPDPSRQGAWAKIAQLGGVRIGNDVEIGANTTVDRGALDDTVIGNGVKLDNQIMIAHNVRVGDHTAMAACVGVAGSTVIGKRCTIGGAAMLSGHITLADDVHVSGGTAITSNVSQPGRYTGVYPFAEHGQWQKNAAVISQLAPLRRRVRACEKNQD